MIRRSAHQRYESELERLADDACLLDALGLSGEWRRVYARFFPDQDPCAVIALATAERILRVDVFAGMRLAVRDAADDVPGLRAVLAAGAEIVRYHPGRR
jgi:hypothetical protein